MKRIAGLLVVVAVFAASVSAPALRALKGSNQPIVAYVQINGKTQGQFKGSGRSRRKLIPVFGFQQSVTAPRDVHAGKIIGKRQHGTITLTFDGADAAELTNASNTHEVLSSVVIQQIAPAGPGKVRHTRNITLTNAYISSINFGQSGRRGQGGKGSEERTRVSFTYQKIDIQLGGGKTSSADDWTSG